MSILSTKANSGTSSRALAVVHGSTTITTVKTPQHQQQHPLLQLPRLQRLANSSKTAASADFTGCLVTAPQDALATALNTLLSSRSSRETPPGVDDSELGDSHQHSSSQRPLIRHRHRHQAKMARRWGGRSLHHSPNSGSTGIRPYNINATTSCQRDEDLLLWHQGNDHLSGR